MSMSGRFLTCLFSPLLFPLTSLGEEAVFPHRMPEERPDIELSSAMKRMFEYSAPRVQDNELFSQFKYTRHNGSASLTQSANGPRKTRSACRSCVYLLPNTSRTDTGSTFTCIGMLILRLTVAK